jgi:hypothetical protein
MDSMKRLITFFANLFAHLMAVPSRETLQYKTDWKKMNNFVPLVAIYFLTWTEMCLDPVIAKQSTKVCSNKSQTGQTEECHLIKKEDKAKNKQKAG